MKPILLVLALLLVPLAFADTGPRFDVSPYLYGSSASVASCSGFTIYTNSDITITGIGVATSSGATRAFVYVGNVSSGTGSCTGSQYNGTVSGTTATLSKNVTISAGGLFTVLTDAAGASYSVRYDTAPPTPQNGNSSVLIWKNGVDNAGLFDHFARNVRGVYFTGNVSNVSGPPTITLTLTNLVNGSSWPNTLTFFNVTGTLTFNYFNITGTGFCVTYTGNGTGTNCTTSGSGPSTFFNVTNSSVVVTTTQSISAVSYQALINLSAKRLFLNTTISTFNATNNVFFNSTSTTYVQLPALDGGNNIIVQVLGNYSKNVTCTVASPLTTIDCEATGIYDNVFTIGANLLGTSISNFTVIVNNSIATLTNTTTNGFLAFGLLRGYSYNFFMNATGSALANITLTANASTNLYNFSLLIENTFNFTIYNESTGTLITQNVTLTIIRDTFAANYTFSGGNFSVSLLVPGDYTITYYIDSTVPRNYYVTLSPQSYENIDLYIIDAGISQLYLPIVLSESTVPLSNVTVKLLRDYIISGSTHEYVVVEMAKTDTNGQAVLRVVPNIIYYKLIITDGTNTLSTTPTKFTASTNTYTLNTRGNPVTSLLTQSSVAKSLTFNNATSTFTFTWNDDTSVISQGCITVLKFDNGVQTTDLNTCSSGATGSITHTVNDTNNTRYVATTYLDTNTQYGNLLAGTLEVNYDNSFASFGLVGFIVAAILFITFIFIGGESGISGMMVGGAIALLVIGAFSFIASNLQITIGIIIVVGLIIYRLGR